MAVVDVCRWAGASLDQYREVRRLIGWADWPPKGGVVVVVAHDGEALRIFSVWDDPEAFAAFAKERFRPAAVTAGLLKQPEIEVLVVHDLFTHGPKA